MIQHGDESRLSHPLIASLLAILCTILWGSAYPAIKLGYELFSVDAADTPGKLAFAGIRFAIAGVMVLLFSFFAGRSSRHMHTQETHRQSLRSLTGQQWFQIMVLALAQTTVHYYFFYVGVSFTTGAKSSIINSSSVFFSALLAHLFYANDRVSGRKGVGILIGFIAVILVNFEPNIGFSFLLQGEGFVMIAALLHSAAGLYSKRISQTIDPVLLTGSQLLLGGVLLLIIGMLMGAPFPTGGAGAYLLLAYMALLSAVAFSVWTSLLKHNKVSSITVFNFIIPVSGTLLSAAILGESILQIQYLIALPAVAAGIYLVNSTGKKRGELASS